MDTNQIRLVKTTFSDLVPHAESVAAAFYARLFELDPATRALFKGDMKEQGRKLLQMLGLIVNSLDRLEVILPTVQNLGRHHVGYGVRDEHYDTVGSALLWTLQQGLAEKFDSQAHAAWFAAYTLLATEMKAAARPSPTL